MLPEKRIVYKEKIQKTNGLLDKTNRRLVKNESSFNKTGMTYLTKQEIVS